MNQPLNIVMFNMSIYSDWETGIVNRNYHILKNLISDKRVNKILAIDFLPFNFKMALKNYIESQIGFGGTDVIKRDTTSKLTKKSEKLFIYSTLDSYFSPKNLNKKIPKIINNLGMKDNLILWSYLPTFTEFMGKLGEKLVVFDTVDNWMVHPSYSKVKKKLKANYQIINEKNDLIFVVSEELISLFSNKNKVHFIPNGIDVDHFQKEARFISRDIISVKKPIIGYLGIIQDRVDVDILEYLAQKNPDKSLVLIGQIWPIFLRRFRRSSVEVERLSRYPNVHFLGPKSYEETPSYLQQFTVGIIPHKVNEFTKSMNPLKLYEYLACGLPVVTTPISGKEMFLDLISVAKDKEEFNAKVNEVVTLDNEELKRKRQEAVKIHSWEKRVDKMLELIFEKLK